MKGKEKCKALKEIRKQIAEQNDIEYVVSECKHQGECKGTCPKCEAEIAYLERELEFKKNLGKAVVIAGIATSVCTGLTACSPIDTIQNIVNPNSKNEDIAGEIDIVELEGDVAMPYEPDDIPGDNETTPIDPEGESNGTDIIIAETVEGLVGSDEDMLLEGELLMPSDTEETSGECDESDEILEGDIAIDPSEQ